MAKSVILQRGSLIWAEVYGCYFYQSADALDRFLFVVVFGWFEEVALFQGAHFLSNLNRATFRNKSPIGSVHQKYVCTCFMVKMRIKIGILWAFVVLFGLRIMCEEVKCEI